MSTTTKPDPTTSTTLDQAAKVTSYIVLGKDNSGYYQIAANLKAGSAEAAVRACAQDSKGEQVYVAYVAVPERSWRPVKVKAETRTVLKLENA